MVIFTVIYFWEVFNGSRGGEMEGLVVCKWKSWGLNMGYINEIGDFFFFIKIFFENTFFFILKRFI